MIDGLVLNIWFGPGFGTVASVPTVPQYQFPCFGYDSYCFLPAGFGPSSQEIICIYPVLVLVRFHFVSILVPNLDGRKSLVVEPKLTRTLSVQICQYLETKVSFLCVFSVLAQHKSFHCLNVRIIVLMA